VARGHYFARRTNRFWPSFSRSVLSDTARAGLGVAQLAPEHDGALLQYGFGFTDVAKRATANVRGLAPGELAAAVPLLVAKLARYEPRIACFHGVTGYARVHETLPGAPRDKPSLGAQTSRFGPTRIFLVPNPSPANAHFTPADQTAWYDRLARFLGEVR
jgi:TDG/mug DNA glycosylase family protein